jgi:hypothetical protein
MLVIAFTLLLLLVALDTTEARASSAPPHVLIGVSGESLSVSINLDMYQNITALLPAFSLPQLHGDLEGANSTRALQAIQNATREKAPTAQLSELKLQAATSAWSSTANLQWFNISLSFSVSGISTVKNGIDQFDMSWKSFVIASNVSIGGFEVNGIGAGYLAGVASTMAQQTSSQAVRISFVANSIPIFTSEFPSQVERFTALNFSSLSTPVSSWKSNFDSLTNTMSWSFNPRHGRNVAEVKVVTAAGETAIFYYGLFYDVGAKITAPIRSWVSGDTLTVDVSDLPQTLMGITVVSTLVVGVGTFVTERRILNKGSKKRPKR